MPVFVDEGGEVSKAIRQGWQAAAWPAETGVFPDVRTSAIPGPTLWRPLTELLVYRLGWTWPGHGLGQWRELGYTTTDPILGFLWSTWGPGLEVFEHFLRANSELWPLPGHLQAATGRWQKTPEVDATSLVTHLETLVATGATPPSVAWMAESASTDKMIRWYLVDALSAQDPQGQVTVDAKGGRHTALVTSKYSGWYGTVQSSLTGLKPRADGRNWRMDATVRSVGWMGTFRLSAVTGRAFACRHTTHMLGQTTSVEAGS